VRVGLVGFGFGVGHRGGVQVYLRDLVRALDAHDTSGHEYTLLLGPGDEAPRLSARFRIARLESVPLGGSPWRRAARVFLEGASALDRLGLDVVHYPATRLHEPAPSAPAVLTFFDMQEEFLPRLFRWRERAARRVVHRRSVRRAALVIAPSRFTADCLRERYGTPRSKLRVIPAGVGDEFFAAPEADDGARLRGRYGLEAGGFALYPANPWPHKNHLRLFRALARLDGRPGGAPLVVCMGRVRGERRRVSALAEAAGLRAERVRDLGFVPEDDLPRLLRAARLLVFPSLFEGFGLPVAEALAAGCPVACAAIAPLVELAGDAACTFDPQDEAAIAGAVGALWDDAGERERLVARGRARAETYRWERLVPEVVAAYAAAAGRG
jgi:glycosyltransferase involved in cell wall biosynthesis